MKPCSNVSENFVDNRCVEIQGYYGFVWICHDLSENVVPTSIAAIVLSYIIIVFLTEMELLRSSPTNNPRLPWLH